MSWELEPPQLRGGPTFLAPASGVGQSLHYQLFVFVLFEQGLASSLSLDEGERGE